MPYYSTSLIMAYEYVTRAFNIHYNIQHGKKLEEEIEKEKNYGFKNSFFYIYEVYKMVIEYNNDL